MSLPNEDVLENRSAISRKNVDQVDKLCNFCNRKVIDFVRCSKCIEIFHPSCLVRDANRGSTVCQHEAIRSEEMFIPEDLRMENKLLKQQVEYLNEKNKILYENNKLLHSVIENFINSNIKNNDKQQKKTNNINNKEVISYADKVSGEGKRAEFKKDAEVTESRKMTHSNLRLNKQQQTVNVNVNKEMEQDENFSEVNGEEWKQITYQKKKIRPSNPMKLKNELVCNGSKTNNQENTISGATKRKWLYVGRIAGKDVKEEDVEKFLKNTDGLGDIIVKKLDTKGSNSAFSVGLTKDEDYKTVYNKDFWPAGVILREFSFKNFFFKQKGSKFRQVIDSQKISV